MLRVCLILLDEELVNLRKLSKFPRKFLDVKALRGQLGKKREILGNAEISETRKSLVLEHVDKGKSLSVVEALRFCGLSEERVTEISPYFTSFADLLSADEKQWERIHGVKLGEARKVIEKLRKFSYGVKTKRTEGGVRTAVWSSEDDKKLISLCLEFDVTFGDPWLFIGPEINKSPDECMRRFFEISEKRNCENELALTRCMEPLLMNRDFKLMPPRLIFIPTSENHPKTSFTLPLAFRKFRNPDIFSCP